MNPFEHDGDEEDDGVYLNGDEGDVLSAVIPNMERGDCVVLHELECASWNDRRCTCSPLMVHGPSGKA